MIGLVIAAAALVLGLAVSPGSAQRRDGRSELGDKQKDLQQTQRRLGEERAKAADARKREAGLLAELEAIEKRLAAKRQQVAALDGRIQRAQADIGVFATTSAGSRTGAPARRTSSGGGCGPSTGSRPTEASCPSCSRATTRSPRPPSCAT